MESNSTATGAAQILRKEQCASDPKLRAPCAARQIEIESAVLGALMLEGTPFTEVCDLLRPESFYEPKHIKIYRATVARHGSGAYRHAYCDKTVYARTANSESIGGAGYVASLTMNVASAAHVETHAKIVAQKYLARETSSASPQRWRTALSTRATTSTTSCRKPNAASSTYPSAISRKT